MTRRTPRRKGPYRDCASIDFDDKGGIKESFQQGRAMRRQVFRPPPADRGDGIDRRAWLASLAHRGGLFAHQWPSGARILRWVSGAIRNAKSTAVKIARRANSGRGLLAGGCTFGYRPFFLRRCADDRSCCICALGLRLPGMLRKLELIRGEMRAWSMQLRLGGDRSGLTPIFRRADVACHFHSRWRTTAARRNRPR